MSTTVKVVNLAGELVRSTVEAQRETLREAIDSQPRVLASLTQVEDIDLYGVQLLYAARAYADRQDRGFALTGDVTERVAVRLYESGFVSSILRDGPSLDAALHGYGAASGEQDNA